MASLTHPLDTKQITISLKLPRFFGIRMWLTIKVLALAGMIAPFTTVVEVVDD